MRVGYCQDSDGSAGNDSSAALQSETSDLGSRFIFRWALSAALAGQGMFFNLGYNLAKQHGEAPAFASPTYIALHSALLLSALAVLLLLGGPLMRNALDAIRDRTISVEALFILSALGALGGSLISSITGEGPVYYEVISVVFCVYALGKHIGVQQKGKVGAAVAAFRHAFDSVLIRDSNGSLQRCAYTDLAPRARVYVHAGEPIAVDGKIVAGTGYVRETPLTGEPSPVRKAAGECVYAGTWSVDGDFTIETTGKPRQIDAILAVMESARQSPSALQQDADRLMQFFVPTVALVSLLTFAGWYAFGAVPVWQALFNAMAVLLVACPCALGLATPAGIWAGLFHMAQSGCIGRSGPFVDSLARCTDVYFDKTGTLSHFDMAVATDYLLDPYTDAVKEGSHPDDPAGAPILSLIASMAAQSPHPVSRSLATLAPADLPVQTIQVHPGSGLSGTVAGHAIVFGERSLLLQQEIVFPSDNSQTGFSSDQGKAVHVAVDGAYCGYLVLQEQMRPEAPAVLQALATLGIDCHILSGDPAPRITSVGDIPVQGGLSPENKADIVRKAISGGRHVIFVGDGINDLAAMEAAHAAIAVDLGAALATEYADGIMANGNLAPLAKVIRQARRLRQRLRALLRFALFYNIFGMALAAAGLLHPVVAALLMVGSSAIVSFQAIRQIEK